MTTLPKALQDKGRQLVSRIKTTQWNDRGEVYLLHEGMVVPGSNVVDIVHDLLCKHKTSDPIGWQQFGTICVQHTYSWNWSEMLLGGDTFSNGNGR